MTLDELRNVMITPSSTLQEFFSMYVKEEFGIRDILDVNSYKNVDWESAGPSERKEIVVQIKSDLRQASIASI